MGASDYPPLLDNAFYFSRIIRSRAALHIARGPGAWAMISGMAIPMQKAVSDVASTAAKDSRPQISSTSALL
jgi:hypothetical protein